MLINNFWFMLQESTKIPVFLEGLPETLRSFLSQRDYSAGEREKQGEWKRNVYPYVLENV